MSCKGKAFFQIRFTVSYHQIRMRRGDEYKTTFKTHHGLWEFCVMPFGLINAPPTFQALMHEIFVPYIRKSVLVFFDNILVYYANLEDHIRYLIKVFELLHQNRLFARRLKCNFAQTQVEYLGHVISGEGVSTYVTKWRQCYLGHNL